MNTEFLIFCFMRWCKDFKVVWVKHEVVTELRLFVAGQTDRNMSVHVKTNNASINGIKLTRNH